ncbi:SCO6745 family protein [Modestobacter versicolor]|uniref:SCO6745 family protein n=1 Tax=Modestobacter versicolor TaxID=429133 RepID=UPI0034DF0797
MTGDPAPDVRRLWALAEPFHALTYFADEARVAFGAAGLHGFWAGYFAGRAAPLGAVGLAVVTATFASFAPAFVARRVPGIWTTTSPEQALAARLAGVDAAVQRALPGWAGSADAAEAAALARRAAEAVDLPGRPLAAANATLPEPDRPHLALWQALTTLREHRGDGHLATLLQRDLLGLPALVLAAAAGVSDAEWLQRARGWSPAEWTVAADALTARGLLAGGALTADGIAVRAAVEDDTDRLARGPWAALGAAGCDRLAELLVPVRHAVVAIGDWPAHNPIGVPEPPS